MFPSGFDPRGIKPRKQKPRGESFSKPCDEPGDFFSSFVNLSIFIELTLWKINFRIVWKYRENFKFRSKLSATWNLIVGNLSYDTLYSQFLKLSSPYIILKLR